MIRKAKIVTRMNTAVQCHISNERGLHAAIKCYTTNRRSVLLQSSGSFVITPIFFRFMRVPRSEKKTSHPTLILHFKKSQSQGNKLQTWACYLSQKARLEFEINQNSEIMSKKTSIPLPNINNICSIFCLLQRRCLKPTCSFFKISCLTAMRGYLSNSFVYTSLLEKQNLR